MYSKIRAAALRLARRWWRPRRIVSVAATLPSQQAYALWARNYPPRVHNALMAVEQTAMLAHLPDLRDKIVLDLACGTGRYGLLAQASGARLVVGADNSPHMLAAGELRPVCLAGMNALPFVSSSFDVVICALAVGHLPPSEMPPAIAEIGRVLRQGGLTLISDFHPDLAQHGGQRSFTAPDGNRYAVEHFVNFPSEFLSAFNAGSMILEDVIEPRATVEGRTYRAVLILRGTKR